MQVFTVNIPNMLLTAFFIEKLHWMLLNEILLSENNFFKTELVK